MSTTVTGQLKSSAITLNPMVKAGAGWDYDDPNLTYDGATDSEGRDVFYDGIGTAPTMTGQTKSSATTLSALTKS